MAKKKKKVSKKAAPSSGQVSEGMACAILSYILIGVIWFFADNKMRKNKYAEFHAKQGLVLLIASIIFSIAYGIVFAILAALLIFIPVAGMIIIWVLSLLFWLPTIWVIIGIVYAATGKQNKLPVIGKFAEKFKF